MKEIYMTARLNAKTTRSSNAYHERTDKNDYLFQGTEICRTALMIVYGIGEFTRKALIKHHKENGL